MEQKKLYLSKKDKKLAGICGGIAEYANMDATVIRLLFIAAAVFTAFIPVTIGYLVCACIIPTNPLEM